MILFGINFENHHHDSFESIAVDIRVVRPPFVADAACPTDAGFGGVSKGDVKDTSDFKYLTYDTLPAFTDKHKSLMSKLLTQDLFDKLKSKKTSKGYTLSNSIQTGVETPHLGVGLTCGDEECFETFKDIIYPIIKGWHKGYDAATQKHPTDLDASKLKFSADQEKLFDEYVVSTRIRAARNISGFALPSGTDDKDRAGVEDVL